MWQDPIVAEVRQHRKKIEADCENDFDKLFERAMLIQKKYAKKLVSRPTAKAKQFLNLNKFQNDGHWPSHVKAMPALLQRRIPDGVHKYLAGEAAPYDVKKMVRNQVFERE